MMDNIKVKGHKGTWYVIGTEIINGKVLHLLEHETYGDEAPAVIVDENFNLVLEDVHNGFDDYRYASDEGMLVKVICDDGAEFEAETFDDLVAMMKLDMWLPPKTTDEYMKGVAKRCEIWDGSKIEYSNAEEFIRELHRVGVIKEVFGQ